MKMTNPEDQASTTATPKQETASENVPKSEFLERVSEIPVVNAAKEYGTAAYKSMKEYNRFTAAALNVAETAALYFALSAKPVLEKMQPQTEIVDHFACIGLDAVQEKAPFILKPPEQLIEDARKLCAVTVEAGYQKVDAIKVLGAETVSNVKNYGMQKANEALSGTEDLVDKYLPPAFGEGAQEASIDANTVQERASKLTSKIGLRLYGHGVKHFLPLHRLSQEMIGKINYTLQVLEQVKENYGKKTLQEHVDEARTKATWIWEELNKEPASDGVEAEKSLEQRMLSLIRRTASSLVHAYNVTAVPLSTLPTSYQDGLRTAGRYTTEIFSQIDQATNAGEITVSLLQTVREKIVALENVIQGLSAQSEESGKGEEKPSQSESAATAQ